MEELLRRIAEILRRQEAFERAARRAQDTLYESILVGYPELTPAAVARLLREFEAEAYAPLVLQLADDLGFVLSSNVDYFAEAFPRGEKRRIVERVAGTVRTEFGFNADGEVVRNSFLDDVLRDTTVKRDVRRFLIRYGPRPGKLGSRVRNELGQFIRGDAQTPGVLENYFARPGRAGAAIFDTYQAADRTAQNAFAEALELEAAIYTGGLIETSRPFCRERDGKIFLRSEIAAWKDLRFDGKPKTGYDPFRDLGGYRCRHHLGWLLSETALRLDKTLARADDGTLYRLAA